MRTPLSRGGSCRTERNNSVRIIPSRRCQSEYVTSDGLQHLVELTSLLLRSEPLDAEIERRCKQAWEEAPCPECGETAVQTGDASPRVWCTNCRYVFTYTRNTPFGGRTLTPGEIVITFVLYADTLLSIPRSPSSSMRSTTRSTPRFER